MKKEGKVEAWKERKKERRAHFWVTCGIKNTYLFVFIL
jgi:hypothetical protein